MDLRAVGDEEFLVGEPLVSPPARAKTPNIIFRTEREPDPKSIDQRFARRTPVQNPLATPFSAIALLEFYLNANPLTFAGGFFIKPDVLVTAGHNLSSFNFTSIAVSPAFDAVNNPGAPRFSALANVRHTMRDVGIVIVDGFNAATIAVTNAQAHVDCALAGYAIPVPGASPRLTGAQARASFEGSSARYDIPTLKGDSGSPVFSLDGAGVVVIHTDSRLFGSALLGVGERMDEELQAIIVAGEDYLRRRLNAAVEPKGPIS